MLVLRIHWLIVLAIVMISAAAFPAQAQKMTLSGEVTYRERIALPDSSMLRVRLIDMTAPGTPTRVEAEAAIASPGQVPLTFTLNFDQSAIRPDHRHALVAEISTGIELWFRNAQPYPVDPLAPKPIMIVTSFVGRLVEPQQSTTPPQSNESDVALLETTWRADWVAGSPALDTVDSTLSIAGDMRAGGRGGCNSYFAQAAVAGESLRFSAVAATRMACSSQPATDQETAFFDALNRTRFWRFQGDRLVLLDSSGDELVRFARVAR